MVFQAIVVMAVPSLLAGLLLVGLQRWVPPERRSPHNDVAGYVFAMVGAIYAIVLAFAIVAVWEGSDNAGNAVQQEAEALTNVYWNSRAFPAPDRQRAEGLVRGYTNLVINQEWPLMDRQRTSAQAENALQQLHTELQDAKVTTADQTSAQQRALSSIADATSARQQRVLLATQTSISPVFWLGLIVGGIMVVGLTFLFGLPSTFPHVAMTVSLTAIIAFALYLVHILDLPFAGGASIDPSAFQLVLQLASQVT